MTFHRRLSVPAAASVFLVIRAASAQVPTPAALFDEGLEGMRGGHYDSACPKLAESYRLDPLPGVLFTLAECEAAGGKIATAMEHYQVFIGALTTLPPARREKFDERRRLALDNIAALGAESPELLVEVPSPVPNGLVVKVNGIALKPMAFGVGRKVDPGEYVVTAELGEARVWERRVKLELRAQARITVAIPVREEPVDSPALAGSRSTSLPLKERASVGRGFIYVLGGIGIAGLTTGAVAGAFALGQKSIIDQNCTNRLCNTVGRNAVDTGQTAAVISTVGFPVGLAGVAGAVALALFLPSKAAASGTPEHCLQVHTWVDGRGAAIIVRGAF